MAKLVVINGRLRIDVGGTNKLVKVDDDKTCCCKLQLLYIYYDWTTTGGSDLDTKTTFLGDSVGWSCPGMSTGFIGNTKGYLTWSGDSTAANSYETVIADLGKAYNDGMWSVNTTIYLGAGWYGYGNTAIIRVRTKPWYGFSTGDDPTEQMLVVSPGSERACTQPTLATVTVYEDGTFDLQPV